MLRCLIFFVTVSVVFPAFSQFTIRGTVWDSDKAPIAGANVIMVGTDKGTVADADGRFELRAVATGACTLEVSFMGYVTERRELAITSDVTTDFILFFDTKQLEPLVVLHPTRASEATPTTYVNLSRDKLKEQNFGQDMPFLLNWTPSVVTTSDAGAGIGYTGIRIRGTDATRVNVTINGIPYNDSESQSTFWVDIPDIASSTKSIQIQRGVGTSSNGPGAFGASVNLDTRSNRYDTTFAEAMIGVGSFGAQRYTLRGGYQINNFFVEGKLSRIKSDGYVERASADLDSYYFRAVYNGKVGVQAVAFGGAEKTYQAWYGVDEATMQINRRMNYAGAIYDSLGSIKGYYTNQVDDYKQDHGQVHLSYGLSRGWDASVSFHGTYGRGYYEEYQQGRMLSSVGLPDTMGIGSTDMVVRKWLENYFYGLTYSLRYSGMKSGFVLGGAASWYEPARHFGEIIWTEEQFAVPPGYRYYSGLSDKGDRNVFIKWNYRWTDHLTSFVDFQYRRVNYTTMGTQDDQTTYAIDDQFNFFNPKVGLTYGLDRPDSQYANSLYISYAIANREPNRSDYLGGTTKPRTERLHNLEAGWRKKTKTWGLDLNCFLMQYADQLVQTGALDAAGYPIRANIGKSYRTGLEASAVINLLEKWSWNVNLTWSANKNKDYVVFENNQPVNRDTRIILTPDWIAGSQLAWKPIKGFEAAWLSKYVGKQYLDNTESEGVSLSDYWINDLRFSYEIKPKGFQVISWSLLINNLMNVKYASNGYSDAGVPYYYPQAGMNFMAMMTVRL